MPETCTVTPVLVQREQELVTPECVVAVSRFDVGRAQHFCFLAMWQTAVSLPWGNKAVSFQFYTHHSSRKKKDIECVLDCLGNLLALSSLRNNNAINELIQYTIWMYNMATNVVHLHNLSCLSKVSLPRKQQHTRSTSIGKLHDYIMTASASWRVHLSAPMDFAGHVGTDPATAQQAAGEVEEAIFLSSWFLWFLETDDVSEANAPFLGGPWRTIWWKGNNYPCKSRDWQRMALGNWYLQGLKK